MKTSQEDILQKCKKIHDVDLGPENWNGTAYSADLCKYSCVLLGKTISEHYVNAQAICKESPLSVSVIFFVNILPTEKN